MDRQQVILTAALLLILCLVVLCLPLGREPAASNALCISEICAKNDTILADSQGRYCDYIELYNPGDPLDLTGYCVTDGKAFFPLEAVILDTGEYRVFFLGQHTGISLKPAGGTAIQLLAPDGTIAAQAATVPCGADEVTAYIDGTYVRSLPSPGFSNDVAGIQAFTEGLPSDDMPVVISEILVENRSALPDATGNFCDVVELQNISQEDVCLSGWYLSDTQEDRYRYPLPSVTLAPGEFLLLFCDGSSRITADQIHPNFGFSSGEGLWLTDNRGHYHSATGIYDISDVSLSRLADGSYAQSAPSLGYTNDETGIANFIASRTYADSPLRISQVLLSSSGIPYDGAVTDVAEITNFSNASLSTAGWYLTDNENPQLYPLPAVTLAAGESLVIPCTKGSSGFALSVGETLRLMSPEFLVASSVLCETGAPGESILLRDSGDTAFYSHGPNTLDSPPTEGLIFSECMSSNSSYLPAADRTTCDWIEFCNNSDQVIQLADYSISTDSNSDGYKLPEAALAPGDYVCILFTEPGVSLRSGYSSLPLALSSQGEALYLRHNGRIADYMLLPALGNNEAYGRPAGSNTMALLRSPTPGKSNSTVASVSASVTVLTAPGVYENVESLEIILSAPGEIYYTTNCTTPNRNAKRYTGPITITKTTVLRVVCYESGKSASKVTDLTYLLNEGDSLSAICIVTEPHNLWDFASGIYANGPGYTEEFPHRGANFWEDWEYPATLTFFDEEGDGFSSVPFGLKIYGGFSRGFAKKSLACMFRASYGASSLEYPIFGEDGLESYEAIVLRAGGQEVFTNRIKDEVITSYVNSTLNIPVQKYRPVVVYLNGKYYGIHFIREKINENYVAGNYCTEPEDVELTYWSGKYNAVYQELITYMKTNRLIEQAHYDYIASRVDLQNYTDYVITQMWIANEDTANVKFFCTSDQPWTWILYDTDMSMYNPALDSLIEQLKPSQLRNNDVGCKSLLLLLLENESYRDYFLERVAWQVNNVWNADTFIAHVDAVAAEIAADIPKDCDRWSGSYESWERSVEKIRTFARERLPYFLDSIQRHFDLTDQQMERYGFILPND